jgi:UDP-glucose 4-epimerase
MERGSPGDVFNVGGGEEASMLDAIHTLEQLSGRTLELRQGTRRKGDQPRTLADTTRIREKTGWEPRTPFPTGLEAQWRWAADRVASR